MKRLRQFLKLAPQERRIVALAIPALAAVRLCLWVVPFSTLHRKRSSVLSRLSRYGERDALPPERIVWLVAVASRLIPGAHCLPRAIAAQLLLARAGHLTELHIGVRKNGKLLDAHAWLEYEGVPLFESNAHLNGYTSFSPAITYPRKIPNAPK